MIVRPNVSRIAVITTHRSLSPAIKRHFKKTPQTITIHYLNLKWKHVASFIDDLLEELNDSMIIWAIDPEERALVNSILTYHEASVIPSIKETLGEELNKAVTYHPYLALTFQELVLKEVQKGEENEEAPSFTQEPFSTFNQTEKDIVHYLFNGYKTEEIANKACISVHTVNNNISRIKKKLRVKNKIEIVKRVIEVNRASV
ncbi:LuxR C-terminal-related transcriptional regulator (plasmid) [Alkalihalophilus pseudofirmus]|uniref:helix-turn-helix transcriptional regulator n=1 Tax=Alkalihalophilus pseudofirmus TaxID=79885 RepID=UPI00259B6B01|nr:LuxR C-terminal-related transcriptional regulator [Alkalihalophilus pseudofirmus]WEG19233.1 LuxR C-terminal-related transcriptional regulator [Alkalihalophilus pseudofirmus]